MRAAHMQALTTTTKMLALGVKISRPGPQKNMGKSLVLLKGHEWPYVPPKIKCKARATRKSRKLRRRGLAPDRRKENHERGSSLGVCERRPSVLRRNWGEARKWWLVDSTFFSGRRQAGSGSGRRRCVFRGGLGVVVRRSRRPKLRIGAAVGDWRRGRRRRRRKAKTDAFFAVI